MIEYLPQLKPQFTLGTLGYYEYKACLMCAFGGVTDNKVLDSGSFPSPIPNKQLIIGNIFHALMDYAKSCTEKSELIEYANKLFSETEDKYLWLIKGKKLGPIKSWSEIGHSLKTALKNISNGNKSTISSNTLLISKNKRFKGLPDLYFVNLNEAFVKEYKSSTLYRDGEIKDEYLDQVKFYSYLLLDNYRDITSFNCELQSLSGEVFKIDFSSKELNEYEDILNSSYLEIESRLHSKNNYIFENCVKCTKKVVCETFLRESKHYDVQSKIPVFVLTGVVNSIETIANGLYIKIDDQNILIGASFGVNSIVKIGKSYVFYNLIKEKTNYIYSVYSGIYGK